MLGKAGTVAKKIGTGVAELADSLAEGKVALTPEGVKIPVKMAAEGEAAVEITGNVLTMESDTVKAGIKVNPGQAGEAPQVTPAVKVEAKGTTKQWTKFDIGELKKIGKKSLQDDIRVVQGSANDAFEFFKAQVKIFTEVKPGVYRGEDGNGIIFVYRPISKSGPPTIDVNGIKSLRKIKFLND